jgi:hypothetical protein
MGDLTEAVSFCHMVLRSILGVGVEIIMFFSIVVSVLVISAAKLSLKSEI